ncbi:MAG: hypothetical protein KJO54_00450 [Gammaproteobacteria bacterium]|nr:hypothetical protein [Gammaproteobacteria bacterium]NNF61847.1 hypothetical protein [Gammaproteobacteria bacterium]
MGPATIQDAAVFVVEENPSEATHSAFDGLPWPVHRYPDFAALLDSLVEPARGCVVASVDSPGEAALTMLEQLRSNQHRLALILVCDRVDVPEAVAAMRAGVSDVLQRPVAARALRHRVQGAVESRL